MAHVYVLALLVILPILVILQNYVFMKNSKALLAEKTIPDGTAKDVVALALKNREKYGLLSGVVMLAVGLLAVYLERREH